MRNVSPPKSRWVRILRSRAEVKRRYALALALGRPRASNPLPRVSRLEREG